MTSAVKPSPPPSRSPTMSVSGELGKPDLLLKPVAVSVRASSCPVTVAVGRASPAETRAILTNGERPRSISRRTNTAWIASLAPSTAYAEYSCRTFNVERSHCMPHYQTNREEYEIHTDSYV